MRARGRDARGVAPVIGVALLVALVVTLTMVTLAGIGIYTDDKPEPSIRVDAETTGVMPQTDNGTPRICTDFNHIDRPSVENTKIIITGPDDRRVQLTDLPATSGETTDVSPRGDTTLLATGPKTVTGVYTEPNAVLTAGDTGCVALNTSHVHPQSAVTVTLVYYTDSGQSYIIYEETAYMQRYGGNETKPTNSPRPDPSNSSDSTDDPPLMSALDSSLGACPAEAVEAAFNSAHSAHTGGGSNNGAGESETKYFHCHAPPGNPANYQMISVGSEQALQHHLHNHNEDRSESCPEPTEVRGKTSAVTADEKTIRCTPPSPTDSPSENVYVASRDQQSVTKFAYNGAEQWTWTNPQSGTDTCDTWAHGCEISGVDQTAEGHLVAVSQHPGAIYRIADDGTTAWQYNASSEMLTDVDGGTGHVFVVGADGYLAKVASSNKTDSGSRVVWMRTHGSADVVSVTATDTGVYVTEQDGSVAKYSTDGTLLWTESAVKGMATDMAVATETSAFYTVDEGGIAKFDAESGTMQWYATKGTAMTEIEVAVNETYLYVGDQNGQVQILDATDGSVVSSVYWPKQFSEPISCTEVGANGELYLGSGDGRIGRFAPSGKWNYWDTSTGHGTVDCATASLE